MAFSRLVALRRALSLINSSTQRHSKVGLHLASANNGPVQIDMPALSPTMEEGTIVSWVVDEGAEVSIGDALCEVETDKAVVTMEAVEDGVLAKILLAAGTPGVKIGTPIAIIAEDGEDVKEAAAMKITSSTIDVTPPDAVVESPTTTTADTSSTSQAQNNNLHTHSHRLVSPAVRQLLQQYGIDMTKVNSSGPHDVLLKGDILKYINQNNLTPQKLSAPAPIATKITKEPATATPKPTESKTEQPLTKQKLTSSFEDVDLTGMRKIIAKRLTESKQTIPHTYASIDCAMNDVLQLRRDLLKRDIKVSVNDFIVKAVARTLQNFPQVNTVWEKDEAIPSKTVDVSIAVATDTGLVTPIVKNADSKGISAITSEIRELAGRARNGKLRPAEFQGGSFTISNLGMFGIKEFTAIINPPQVCIMAIGGSRVVPSKCPETNEMKTLNMMTVTMSSDARIVDANDAEQFLTQFKTNIENPLLMI